jgi:hypothetical protein
MTDTLPDLKDWEPTRATLHAYAKVVGAVPRALAKPHPKWWHVSLKVSPQGLVTDRFQPLTGTGMTLQLLMDLKDHTIKVLRDDCLSYQVSMKEGLSAIQLADLLEQHLRALGVEVDLERAKFEDASIGDYDLSSVATYFRALSAVDDVIKQVRGSLDGEIGIVQLWPHNFDLAFEWFSPKLVQYDHAGEVSEAPAQINFGFAPGDSSHPAPYFYSCPLPFDEAAFTQVALPSGARWFQESWEGSIMAYSALSGDKDFRAKLEEYFLSVFRVASPLLSA